MKYVGRVFSLFIIFSMLITCKAPFGPNQDVLTGLVTDNNGNPVMGASVRLQSVYEPSEQDSASAQEAIRETRTNEKGEFTFNSVPLTQLKITAKKEGMIESSRQVDLSQYDGWGCKSFYYEYNLSITGAPSLLSPIVIPDSASATKNIAINISIFVQDASGSKPDAPTVQATVFDHAGVAKKIIPLTSATTSRSGVFTANFYCQGLKSGDYKIEFLAVDADGNKSNTATTPFRIIP